MQSLADELLGKIRLDPRVTARGGPRADLGLLLFGAREDLNALWKAAEAAVSAPSSDASAALALAVEKLRPIFGERLSGT